MKSFFSCEFLSVNDTTLYGNPFVSCWLVQGNAISWLRLEKEHVEKDHVRLELK